MSEDIKKAVEDGIKAIETKMAEKALIYEKQIKDVGDANEALKEEIKKMGDERATLLTRMTELEQKGVKYDEKPEVRTLGQQFIASDQFKAMDRGSKNAMCRIEVKNTLVSDGTTVLPQQIQELRGGPSKPLTVYQSLPHAPCSSNSLEGIREKAWTNNAGEVVESALKPESELTFEPFDFPVRTIPHYIKVSRNVLLDSATIAAYIDLRLNYGVMERVDKQLLVGDGASPNLSGLLHSGNYTVYSPTVGDNLVDAIGRAKWQLWAAGWIPNAVYVSPADWGNMELAKGSDGHYLYGVPGLTVARNPFDVQIIPSPFVPAGQFLIGAFPRAVTVWDREGVVIEAGYADDDFIRNKITLRAEMRLAFEISTPSAILGGEFTAQAPAA